MTNQSKYYDIKFSTQRKTGKLKDLLQIVF